MTRSDFEGETFARGPGLIRIPRARDLLHRVFQRILKKWSLQVTWSDGSQHIYGDGSPPRSAIRLTEEAERGILTYPALRLGESYMNGSLTLEKGDIYDLLQVFVGNRALVRMPGWMRAAAAAGKLTRIGLLNDTNRSRRNVAHHYDLDGRLYDLFLDGNRQYSCAYFEREGMTLDKAQDAKLKRIGRKLFASPGMRALDIGSGWGGLGCHLAKAQGLNVTGVTLSEEQLAAARALAESEGLSDRVHFELRDYREVEDTFDRIVSVGMLEHVGRPQLKPYFSKVHDLLAADGVALVHSIGNYTPGRPTNPWMAKYIFPGGYIPSLADAMEAVEESGLLIADVEIWRLHYAETLKAWRERFTTNRARAAALYDERFCRMWEFYLAGSECGFRYGRNMVFQLLLVKDRGLLPPSRSWMES